MSANLFLIVNAGSSSIKAALYDGQSLQDKTQLNDSNPLSLTDKLFEWIESKTNKQPIAAIGHRIVHGGNEFYGPTKITDQVKTKLNALTFLDPQHLPQALQIIEKLDAHLPDTTQIACFDTAFFHDLPDVAQIIPLPREYEDIGLRKYGFHGLSYQSLLDKLTGRSIDIHQSKIVCAHLGSGASVAAIANGRPVDTTMAFTPASGIPMSTRSGSIDPGIPSFLEHTSGVSIQEFTRISNNESGLLGVSETTGDMLKLLQQEADDPRSKEAVDLFCYEVKKTIGAFSAAMGGVDILVFAGGIGEKAPKIRSRICKGLEYLGVSIDEQHNLKNTDVISTDNSAVSVHVVQSDEELVIVNQIRKYINQQENMK